MDELLDYLDGKHNNYQVWYITIQSRLKKRKGFENLKQVEQWCKKQKGKIIITGSSWQVFEIMETILRGDLINEITRMD